MAILVSGLKPKRGALARIASATKIHPNAARRERAGSPNIRERSGLFRSGSCETAMLFQGWRSGVKAGI
jgi:hypothetical protein